MSRAAADARAAPRRSTLPDAENSERRPPGHGKRLAPAEEARALEHLAARSRVLARRRCRRRRRALALARARAGRPSLAASNGIGARGADALLAASIERRRRRRCRRSAASSAARRALREINLDGNLARCDAERIASALVRLASAARHAVEQRRSGGTPSRSTRSPSTPRSRETRRRARPRAAARAPPTEAGSNSQTTTTPARRRTRLPPRRRSRRRRVAARARPPRCCRCRHPAAPGWETPLAPLALAQQALGELHGASVLPRPGGRPPKLAPLAPMGIGIADDPPSPVPKTLHGGARDWFAFLHGGAQAA